MTREAHDTSLQSSLVLGIETSGLAGSIALCRGAECLSEVRLEEAPRRHAQTLVSQVGVLLRESGHRVRDLHAVSVSIGPGSFTGLRVGVVCAKTLAYATGCQLAAVDTLQAIAANCPAEVERVHVIADALRGDAYVATYDLSGGIWQAEHPPTIAAAQAWLAERAPGEVISGPGLASYADFVPQGCRQLPVETWTPRAAVVARLGLGQLDRGDRADCATLVPFYLRRSAAEERKSRSE
ncbi:MAG TPA: tRNA (adenosine(37)-N6)-threonylcarbamoyltransferase complex dimerization subunit type 1 TsaB [Planctomycetaceae bacterium]|jgi:tRNA threonylcarbamoyladenosine biosynthesis protein TsaB|nr:tRNA (adenosine(37)-N6)-threonylcarbamoyltransferase complex dimerization subunit type 1 TsaB [Planctomycetaceae bacterium]